MADVFDLVFKTFTGHPELTAAPPSPLSRSSSSSSSSSVLVVGERSLSRSVLLLAAVTAASQLGLRVLFFSRSQIQSLPKTLHKRAPGLSPESLKLIRFIYPRTVEELLLQVASLHESVNTSPSPPSLVVVDGLDAFLSGPRGASASEFHSGALSRAAHLAALLCDTAAFLTHVLQQKSSGAGHCRIITSFQPEPESGRAGAKSPSASDPVLDVLDRYFLLRCTLDLDRGQEATAAGLQQLWHVYLSGRGITEDREDGEDREDRQDGQDREDGQDGQDGQDREDRQDGQDREDRQDGEDGQDGQDGQDGAGVAQEWKLLISPDGLMEFKVV